jgi:hypothetical protein
MITTANHSLKTDFDTFKVAALAKVGIVDQGIEEDSPPLEAFINHGRWVVKCECGGCEKAWEEGLFICQSCFNSGHKHKIRKAIFPKDRKQIEQLLEVRPLPNRNWQPHETLADLEKENEQHKAELLEVN